MIVIRAIAKLLSAIMIGMVRLYQIILSPILPPVCRFQPSCSRYMIEALRRKGPVVGLLKGTWRVLRCNPFCKGGYDPVDPNNPPRDC